MAVARANGSNVALLPNLHQRLIALQSDEELQRKAKKARERANLWSQEELDAADREAKRLYESLKDLWE